MAEEKAELGSVGAALAAVYGSGLVTINIFLGHLGLADFSLVKPKAIFTGTIVLASLATLAAGPIHVVAQLRDDENPLQRPFTRRFMATSAGEILVPMIVIFAICWLVARHPEHSLGGLLEASDWVSVPSHPIISSFSIAVGFFLSACAVAVLAVESVRLFKSLKEATSFPEISTRLAKLIFLSAGCLLSLSLYMDLFAGSLYIFVPQVFGGGSPEEKSLLIQHDSLPDLRKIGFKFVDDQSAITEPVSILYESDDSLGVIVRKRVINQNPGPGITSDFVDSLTVVRLDRKMVQAVIIPGPSVHEIERPER
jgi:hypothetical protein